MVLEDSSNDSGLNTCIWQLVSTSPRISDNLFWYQQFSTQCHKAHIHIKQKSNKYLKCGMTLTAKGFTDKDLSTT